MSEELAHCRFGKRTHISMISNSVTHLRSYINSAIAGNSMPISPRDRRAERRRLRIDLPSNADIVASNDLRAIANVAAPNADVSTSSANIVASNNEYFMMFHNVLRVFHDVLLVVYDVSQCFTCVLLCLPMFYDVYESRNQGSRQRRRDR